MMIGGVGKQIDGRDSSVVPDDLTRSQGATTYPGHRNARVHSARPARRARPISNAGNEIYPRQAENVGIVQFQGP